MISNFKIFVTVFLWYLLPYVFLAISGHTLQIVPVILFLFLVSFSFAYVFFKKYHIEDVSILRFNYTLLFKRVIIISLILSFYGLYKYYMSGGEVENIREAFYETSGGVFENTYIYTAYDSFLAPSCVLALAWLLNANDFNLNKKYVIIGLVFFLIDGFFRQGRFQYLYALFFIFIFKDILKIKTTTLFLCVCGIFFMVFYTLYTRAFVKDFAINSFYEILDYDLIGNSTINYQFYGYVYLDQLLKDSSIYGNFFEFNSFSFLFYTFNTFLFTKIGMYIEYPWEARNLDISIGTYTPIFDVNFNAFCTNFYPIYLDAGVFGIILFGFLSGFIIAIKSKGQYVNFLKTITVFTLIFGIYQPVITYLVGFFFLVLGISFVIKSLIKLY